jgi:hypothetical protein
VFCRVSGRTPNRVWLLSAHRRQSMGLGIGRTGLPSCVNEPPLSLSQWRAPILLAFERIFVPVVKAEACFISAELDSSPLTTMECVRESQFDQVAPKSVGTVLPICELSPSLRDRIQKPSHRDLVDCLSSRKEHRNRAALRVGQHVELSGQRPKFVGSGGCAPHLHRRA